MPIDRAKLKTLVKANLLAKPPRMTADEVQAKYLALVDRTKNMNDKATRAAMEAILGEDYDHSAECNRLTKQKRALIGTMIKRGITVPNYEQVKTPIANPGPKPEKPK